MPHRQQQRNVIALWSAVSSQDEASQQLPPPPPPFEPKPLPLILGAGLFLFRSSVSADDRPFADELLKLSELAMRADPSVTLEFGPSIESGGVYASQRARRVVIGKKNTTDDEDVVIDQLVLQFQIEGGNAWAQGIAYGIRRGGPNVPVELVSLQIANMDASMNGTPYQIPNVNVQERK